MTSPPEMSAEEWEELLDLALDDALPQGLQARVDAHLAASPPAAADAETLRAALNALHSAPAPRPDPWFVERALQGVLQDHQTDTAAPHAYHQGE